MIDSVDNSLNVGAGENTDIQEKITLLESKRRNLQERLRAIHDDIGNKLDQDSSEQAIELENREVLLEIARVTQDELEKIEDQLQALS